MLPGAATASAPQKEHDVPEAPPREAHLDMTPALLQERLSSITHKRVMLMVTDNTSSIISASSDDPGVLILRAHRIFLDAPDNVVTAIGHWLSGKRVQKDLVQEYIDANDHRIRARSEEPRRMRIRTKGRYHDLESLREHLNKTLLDGRSNAPVTWGRKVSRKRVRSVRLGWYDPVQHLIGISQRLDRSDIPRYMVEYVLFHEMLHEILGLEEGKDGTRHIHGRTFKLLEQTYPHYARAQAFEEKKWG